jgi:phosphoribosylanthranilate isomerase
MSMVMAAAARHSIGHFFHKRRSHLVLSGGLTPANVTDGILQVRPRGLSLAVDVSSGVEADGPDGKPIKGIKDAEKSNALPPCAQPMPNLQRIPHV